jgi:hypothetical protein
MAFSKTEKFSRRLDEMEPEIARHHRWATAEIVLSPDTLDRIRFSVTKQMIRSDDRDLCQG